MISDSDPTPYSTAPGSSQNRDLVRDFLSHALSADPELMKQIADEGLEFSRVVDKALGRKELQQRDLVHQIYHIEELRAASPIRMRRRVSQRISSIAVPLLALSLLATLVISIAKWTGHWISLSYWPIGICLIVTATLSIGASISSDWARGISQRPLETADMSQARLEQDVQVLILQPTISSLAQFTFERPSLETVAALREATFPTRIGDDLRIETGSYREVYALLSQPAGAVVGIAGPRGVGKSELLHSFCDRSSMRESHALVGAIGVPIAAPVAFHSEAFLRELISRVSRAIMKTIPASERPFYDALPSTPLIHRLLQVSMAGIALCFLGFGLKYNFSHDFWENVGVAFLTLDFIIAVSIVLVLYVYLVNFAVAMLQQRNGSLTNRHVGGRRRAVRQLWREARDADEAVRYLETLSKSDEIATQAKVLMWKRGKSRSIAQLPLSEPALVGLLERLVERVREADLSLVVGIDELDKMASDEKAEAFFTNLKVLFPIQECSFLLTVSTQAWSQFARRGLPIRDVFDSSLDAIVSVKPLSLRDSRRVLRRRFSRISDCQVLLCHLITGGLPRDLLRVARQLGNLAQVHQGVTDFAGLLHEFLTQELESRLSATRAWALARLKDDPIGRSRIVAQLGSLDNVLTLNTIQRESLLSDHLKRYFTNDHDGELSRNRGRGVAVRRESSTGADNRMTSDSLKELYTYVQYLSVVKGIFRDIDVEMPAGDVVVKVVDQLVEARRLIEIDSAAAERKLDEVPRVIRGMR